MYLPFALGRTSSVIMGNKPALSLEAVDLTCQVICGKMEERCVLHHTGDFWENRHFLMPTSEGVGMS